MPTTATTEMNTNMTTTPKYWINTVDKTIHEYDTSASGYREIGDYADFGITDIDHHDAKLRKIQTRNDETWALNQSR